MRSAAAKALRFDDEPRKLRDAYGRNVFGQGCLLARRLVESGVPFVEVTLGGAIEERPTTIPDLLATVCKVIGIDTATQNISNTGRPISVVDADAKPVDVVLS